MGVVYEFFFFFFFFVVSDNRRVIPPGGRIRVCTQCWPKPFIYLELLSRNGRRGRTLKDKGLHEHKKYTDFARVGYTAMIVCSECTQW